MTQKASSSSSALPSIDAYDLLDVSLDASEDDIKKAYRKLSLKLHPDKQRQRSSGEEQLSSSSQKPYNSFTDLKDAYDILSDPDRKKLYDRLGLDLGADKLEMAIWNTSNQVFLGPYLSLLIKLIISGFACHLLEYNYLFTLLNVTIVGCASYCFLQIRKAQQLGLQNLDPEAAEKLGLMQVSLIYLGVTEVY